MRSARHDDDYEDGTISGDIFSVREGLGKSAENASGTVRAEGRRQKRRGAGSTPSGTGRSREVRRIEPRFTVERRSDRSERKRDIYTSGGMGRSGGSLR